jgi:DNA primase
MEIPEIKAHLMINQVLDHYGLKADKNNRLNCPFHNDKTPSMQVYAETNTVFCFSSNCKLHGKAMSALHESRGEVTNTCRLDTVRLRTIY